VGPTLTQQQWGRGEGSPSVVYPEVLSVRCWGGRLGGQQMKKTLRISGLNLRSLRSNRGVAVQDRGAAAKATPSLTQRRRESAERRREDEPSAESRVYWLLDSGSGTPESLPFIGESARFTTYSARFTTFRLIRAGGGPIVRRVCCECVGLVRTLAAD